jgi:hypothetical protein
MHKSRLNIHMFGEKNTQYATIVGLAILSVVAVPALIASNAAAQVTTTRLEKGSNSNNSSSNSSTNQTQTTTTTGQSCDKGAADLTTPSSASAAGENSFSSSVNTSPTADSNAKVTIEGTGLTAKQMNVNQERQQDGTVKITMEGVFAVEGRGVAPTTTTPSEGKPSPLGQTAGNETSGNSTATP